LAARILEELNQQDVLRYALTSNAPETKDNDFTWKDFQARNNNELVAIYGISLSCRGFNQ
jgi:methionyl-tRNA synthetase